MAQRPSVGSAPNTPVSVVIAALDAQATLPATLDAILAQDHAGEIEVIVADGSSGDAPCRLLAERYPSVKAIRNPDQTIGAGLNRAIAMASHEVIVRCDAHTTLPTTYVAQAVSTLENTGAACIGGRANPVGTTRFGRAVALATTIWLGSGGSRYRTGRFAGPSDTVYLGTFRRHVLAAVGGFDDTLRANEDYELNWRLRERGETVWFTPEIVGHYRPRTTPRALARQYFRYGAAKPAVLARHPRSWKWRQLAVPTLVAGLGLSALAAGFGAAAALAGTAGPATTALLLCGFAVPAYALVVLGCCAAVGLRRRDATWPLAPVALVTLHFAWAAGFWTSLLRMMVAGPRRRTVP